MEVGAEIELNVENQEEECDEKKKKKRKLVRAHFQIILKQNRWAGVVIFFFESPTYQIKPPFSFEKGSQMKISLIF